MPFKHISRNSVPELATRPNTAVADLEMVLQWPDVPSVKLMESLKWQRRTRHSCGNSNHPTRGRRWIILLSTLPAIRINSGIYPYRHPFSHFKCPSGMGPRHLASRLYRLFIPTIMPTGVGVHWITNEREQFIEAHPTTYSRIGCHVRYHG